MTRFPPGLLGALASGLDTARMLRPVSRLIGRLARGPRFQILTYHRVNDEGDPFFPALPVSTFGAQMRYIAETHTVLPVEELVERMTRNRVPRNAIAITFDDGYRDNLTCAAPIIARHGLPATIFLATGFIGTREVPWFDRLAHALKATNAEVLEAPWGERLSLAAAADRLAVLNRILTYLKTLADSDRRRRLDALLEGLGVTNERDFKNLMLTWDDVQALVGFGFSVGAHTVNHPILSRMSPDAASSEIRQSRAMIESACSRAPRAFAYPNGGPADYTPEIQRLVREAGFTCAVTTRFGLNGPATPPYELRRGGPWERDLPTFALRLATQRAFATDEK